MGRRYPSDLTVWTLWEGLHKSPRLANDSRIRRLGKKQPAKRDMLTKVGSHRYALPRGTSWESACGLREGGDMPGYNLFYADIAADAKARLSAWYGGPLAPAITRRVEVRAAPIHRLAAD